MDREKAMPGTDNDESMLDRVEDALVGDHEEGAPSGSEDPDDRREKPFLKSP
jgi:hypothetical protein